MWLSDLEYREVEVYKDTIFGRQIKKGYELTSPLIWQFKENINFYLDVGYVWDGPSYSKILEWLIGKRKWKSLLAASAMHDIMDKMPVRYGETQNKTTSFNITEGAKLYRKMIDSWPDTKVKGWQSRIQQIFLVGFQWVYRLTSKKSDWKRVE